MKRLVTTATVRVPLVRCIITDADPNPVDPAAADPTKPSTGQGGLPTPPIPPQ